jgi:hypothetical protein
MYTLKTFIMNTFKYNPGMTFGQFLYANYGFSYTQEQANKAMSYYINLVRPNQVNSISKCKEWLKEQRELSGTWQTEHELWELYPFKENGLSKASFSSVLKGLLVCIA